ncbi:hypothetical protein GPECTOR_11g275 [Gonium pectorale]|uniref:Mitotic-spindle organizing protein 1 n=1 Tax=Gonium pectorale TaxID=33097 RepID=A0A150GPP8_GONPE|nr:hypothetical protein GPECTOR_11g275 [Gonium pectorale]|eukprot:KXZ51836.1 hypothetical protein GPECTOR_11g275 [Gonium pectorale]
MASGRPGNSAFAGKQDTTGLPHKAFECALELSQLLDTGIDKDTLPILLELLDAGVNPEALATVLRELQREAADYQAALARVTVSAGAAAAQGQRGRQ